MSTGTKRITNSLSIAPDLYQVLNAHCAKTRENKSSYICRLIKADLEPTVGTARTVSMPTELWGRLDLLCAKQGTTRSALVQQLVTEELRAHKMLELTDEEVAVAAVRAALAAGAPLAAVMSGLPVGKGGAL